MNYLFSNGIINDISPKKQLTSKRIRTLLVRRKNKINDYFNKLVKWLVTKYANCSKVIVGYNEGWKTNVNMGNETNRKFYEIPYRKLLNKLRDALEKNNQELVIIEESYTSKCDALSLEKICRHKKYLGKRVKRGLFSSAKGKLINADLNGAINIYRKWCEREGKPLKKIKGESLYNPQIINILTKQLPVR